MTQLHIEVDATPTKSAYEIIMERVKRSESFLGFDPTTVEQGTDDWFAMRLGVATASKAKDFVAKVGSATRNTYLCQLVAEVATGMQAEQISAKAMEWGKAHEDEARTAFSFVTGLGVNTVPFVYREHDGELIRHFGCSPDGIVEDGGGFEVKCPFNSANHVDFILNKNIKDDYVWQVQFSLWVTGLPHWYFCSYDPRMKVKMLDFVKVMPDPKYQAKLNEAAPMWLADLQHCIKQVCE